MNATLNTMSQQFIVSAESVRAQVLEKGNEVHKRAEELAAPYVDQALELKKNASDQVQAAQDQVQANFIEPASQLRDRITPTIQGAPEAAKQFIDARFEESAVDRHTADVVQLSKALASATWVWVKVEAAKVLQFLFALVSATAIYQQIQTQVLRSKAEVDVDTYSPETLGFYLRWAMLVAGQLVDLAVAYIPSEYSKKIDSTYESTLHYLSPYQWVVDDVKARAEEPLKKVQEYGEPITSAINERRANVEAMVKPYIGDILNTKIPSDKIILKTPAPVATEDAAEPSNDPPVVTAAD